MPQSTVPQLDVAEQAFIAAAPELVAAHVRSGVPAQVLWPGLAPEVGEDRGPEGQRYVLAAGPEGGGAALRGTAEIWLAREADGVLAHVFLRGDPTAPGSWSPRQARRLQDRWRRHIRRALWAIKDGLEADREPGGPVAGAPPPAARAG